MVLTAVLNSVHLLYFTIIHCTRTLKFCTRLGKNFSFLYLNASVNAKGHSHVTVGYSDCSHSFKYNSTQSNAFTDKYLFIIFLLFYYYFINQQSRV